MGSFFSILQGILFAAFNTAIFVFISQEIILKYIDTTLIPRILILFTGLMFLLGTVFMESLSIKRNKINNTLKSGSFGIFIASILCLYIMSFITIITDEITFMIIPSIFIIYTFATILSCMKCRISYSYLIVTLFILILSLITFENTHFSDTISNTFSKYFDLNNSIKTKGYLEEEGGVFQLPYIIPIILTFTSYVIIYFNTINEN